MKSYEPNEMNRLVSIIVLVIGIIIALALLTTGFFNTNGVFANFSSISTGVPIVDMFMPYIAIIIAILVVLGVITKLGLFKGF